MGDGPVRTPSKRRSDHYTFVARELRRIGL